jgi:chromosome segregation ATPase
MKSHHQKLSQAKEEIQALEQSLYNQQKTKETANTRIQELNKILTSQSNLPPLQRDLIQEELTELSNIANRIKTTKTRITKAKKDLTVLTTDIESKQKDQHFKQHIESHVSDYIMKYGYYTPYWKDIIHLLPANIQPFKG